MSGLHVLGRCSLFVLSLACGPESHINTQSLNFSQCIDAQDEDPSDFQNVSTSSSCASSAACSVHSQNLQGVGVAFAFVIATGITTAIGPLAILVCTPRGRAYVTTKLLGGWLSAATGLMLYLAFAELWQDSAANVCCKFPSRFVSFAVTASSFLLGILVTAGLRLGEQFLREIESSASWQRWSLKVSSFLLPRALQTRLSGSTPAVVYMALPLVDGVTPREKEDNFGHEKNASCVKEEPFAPGNSYEDDGKTLGHEGGEVKAQPLKDAGVGSFTMDDLSCTVLTTSNETSTASNQTYEVSFARTQEENRTLSEQEEELHIRGPAEFKEVTDAVVHDQKHLARMGVLTGLAIAIHNFPEGIATFVVSLFSLSLGAVLALAIAIHNIPEGICVAMPVYYATGSKWKGVFWAALSGISQTNGALLAYIALKNVFSPLVYGICFGLISGMMVYIALTELLPTGYKLTKDNTWIVPSCLFIAMGVMSLCLVLQRVNS